MAKLTYWCSECSDDQVYSIIAKTKKEAVAQLASYANKYEDNYGPVHQRVIEYKDAFDLFDKATSEGNGRVHTGRKK